MTRFFLILAMAAALASPAAAQSAVRGQAIFMRQGCYTCHGTTAAGGGALGGPALAHAGLSAAAIFKELRHPVAQMPPYTEAVLPDGDAADIAAYIKALSDEPARRAADIPLLNQ